MNDAMAGMTRQIVVDKIEVSANPMATVAVVTGRIVGTPARGSFACEPRYAREMQEVMTDSPDELLVAVVENWQIIGGGNN